MNIRNSLWPILFLWILLFLLGCRPIAPNEQTPESPPISPPLLSLILITNSEKTSFEPIEFAIEGIPYASNPFDRSEVDLQVTLVGPNSITSTVGGFWYQGFTANGIQPEDEPSWRARFTPSASGEWTASAVLLPTNLASNEVRFTVVDGDNPGFVHVDPNNPRYFAFDDGKRFLPLGVNMGWWNDNPIENYTRWLDHFAANGGNTIRVWMANWAFALEWSDTGLGDYRPRLQQAWLLDELLRLADERGIQVILVLNHHGQFSKTVNPQWDENPYNAALGGPLAAPEQFASDPIAISFFQRRLRYIVDRWGAAPNLLAWEWWNEYNFTTINDSQMYTWLEIMNAYLSARDPYNHLVTISGPAGANSPIWQMQGIDFISVHIYTTIDPLHTATKLTNDYRTIVQDKPLLLAEFGYATGGEGIDSNDKTGIHLHNGLWATIFNGQAGTGMYWWWDTYIEPLDLWSHFASLSYFLQGIDTAEFTPVQATVAPEADKSAGAEGLLLQGIDQHLLWVRSNQYTAAAVDEAYDAAMRQAIRKKEKLEEFVYVPSPLNGLHVQIDGVTIGTYVIQWFDPQLGTWGSVEKISVVDGVLSIPLPVFNQDIAAKIRIIR